MMNRAIRIFAVVTLLTLLSNCAGPQSEAHDSGLHGLALDPNAQNVAGLFTMTNEWGRRESLNYMTSVLEDGSLGFKPEVHHNITANNIYPKLTEMASRVGVNGTLLLYFNSHGGGSGSRFGMQTSGGWFQFSKALNAIAKGKKVRRLVIFIDTCYAEGGINEAFGGNAERVVTIEPQLTHNSQYILPNELPNQFSNGSAMDYGETSEAYEEALVLASASAATKSYRTVFPRNLSAAFKQVKQSNRRDISVAEFLKNFAQRINGQTVFYKALPSKAMLSEPLLGRSQTEPQLGSGHVPGEQSTLRLALGAQAAEENSYFLHVATTATSARVGLCFVNRNDCMTQQNIDVEFSVDPSPREGSIFFVSQRAVVLKQDVTYTILGFDHAGKVTANEKIQFRHN